MLDHMARSSSSEPDDGSRYSSSALIAASGVSAGAGGMSRTSRERMSPSDGPPMTRISSLDEPPLSLTGITNTVSPSVVNASTSAFAPVPPLTTQNRLGAA